MCVEMSVQKQTFKNYKYPQKKQYKPHQHIKLLYNSVIWEYLLYIKNSIFYFLEKYQTCTYVCETDILLGLHVSPRWRYYLKQTLNLWKNVRTTNVYIAVTTIFRDTKTKTVKVKYETQFKHMWSALQLIVGKFHFKLGTLWNVTAGRILRIRTRKQSFEFLLSHCIAIIIVLPHAKIMRTLLLLYQKNIVLKNNNF